MATLATSERVDLPGGRVRQRTTLEGDREALVAAGVPSCVFPPCRAWHRLSVTPPGSAAVLDYHVRRVAGDRWRVVVDGPALDLPEPTPRPSHRDLVERRLERAALRAIVAELTRNGLDPNDALEVARAVQRPAAFLASRAVSEALARRGE